MAHDKPNKKSPIERMREASEKSAVPFKDTTKEKLGQRTINPRLR